MDIKTDFFEKTFQLKPDYEGDVIATLITTKANQKQRKSVLYIHGYVDYFFHPHVAKQFLDHGFDFYALDLRKYGRSILPHQKPNYCEDITEYFEEITLAITEIQKNTNQDIYFLAHSTGCITTALYLNKGEKRHAIKACVMNSPFLEMPQNKLITILTYQIAKKIIRFKPHAKITRTINTIYPHSIHKNFYGEWNFDLSLKPIGSFPTYFKWAVAIADAQRFLQKKSDINTPTLVMFSKYSSKPKRHGKKANTTDTVLFVKHMKKLAPRLGKNITLKTIKGGKHDLFLSQKKVRTQAFNIMFGWLEKLN